MLIPLREQQTERVKERDKHPNFIPESRRSGVTSSPTDIQYVQH